MQNSFDITTVIFIVLALFVAWRLRSVLGQKTGEEQPFDPLKRDPLSRRDPPLNAEPPASDNVVRMPGIPPAPDKAPVSERLEARWEGIAASGSPVAAGLDTIVQAEPSFDAQAFLEGAKVAYEMIVTAFAQGDRKVLKDLLSRDVYEGFDKVIAERESQHETVETTFVSIDGAEIVNAEAQGGQAQITIHFRSKLITATRDASGAVLEGSPDTVADITDIWTFARAISSRDPNWQLVATEAGA